MGRLRRDLPAIDDSLLQDEWDDDPMESAPASPTLEAVRRHHLTYASTLRNNPVPATAVNSLHLSAVRLPSFAPRTSPSAETPRKHHRQEPDRCLVNTGTGEAVSDDSTATSRTAQHDRNNSTDTLRGSTSTIHDGIGTVRDDPGMLHNSTSTLHDGTSTPHSEPTIMRGSVKSTAVTPPPKPTRGRGRPKEAGTRVIRTTQAAMDDAAAAVEGGSAAD